ncbi:MAG: 5'/3'-nucleotidase SurE [Proteobacteria bacterium]|nr:5'/3'-nucleotidase SurE [Pseudomonadota bacterium]MBU1388325.1 5'/3'-nucleotidase SurE [Pseudomonadota bacterium]MBU1542857.1 5'/3'-nucleotidase SurE [Pseudomonadota bacterium]MBU2479677.1 5'/3'-nucleotidase SurE [Pseudomonadota bacterium]
MKITHVFLKWAVLLVFVLIASNCWALNIVVTNDDGFETANITALYNALKDAGHHVIISAPFSGQSGVGATQSVYVPIMPVTEDSPGGTVSAGSPGFGPSPGDPDVFYVNGTPAMAAHYGVDVAAPLRFGSEKVDLVISGPNIGPNLSFVTRTSGTVGAAAHMLTKGYAAIAVSANNGNPQTAPEVAAVVVRIIDRLICMAHRGDALLPEGIGLNINIPLFDVGQGANLEWMHTELGNYVSYESLPQGNTIRFVFHENLSNDMFYGAMFPESYGLGGIGMTLVPVELSHKDKLEGDQVISIVDDQGNVLVPGKVTISVIQAHYGNVDEKNNRFAKKAFGKK